MMIAGRRAGVTGRVKSTMVTEPVKSGNLNVFRIVNLYLRSAVFRGGTPYNFKQICNFDCKFAFFFS